MESSISTIYANGAEISDETDEYIIDNVEEVEVSVILVYRCLFGYIMSHAIIMFSRSRQIGRKSKSNNGVGPQQAEDSDFWFENGRRRMATVTKRVLVLRVVAADAETTGSEADLSDDIFGTGGDPVNLKSQYAKCSYNQLIWDKVENNGIVGADSVLEVTIPNTVSGVANGVIRAAAINKAMSDLGLSMEMMPIPLVALLTM